ncbi:MAG: PKD-like domain-containing protein, partial [Aquaticitalea sp.]
MYNNLFIQRLSLQIGVVLLCSLLHSPLLRASVIIKDFNSHLISVANSSQHKSQAYNLQFMTFAVMPPPIIDSFSPTKACSDSGTTVVITGTNFIGATDVNFNGTVAVFTIDSDTQITTTLPASASTGNIFITTPLGTTVSATVFTVNPSPSVIGGGDTEVCAGSSTPAFTNSELGGTWSILNGSGSATINSNGVVAGVTPGNVNVVYSIGSCEASFGLIVNPYPGSAGILSGPIDVCQGQNGVSYSVSPIPNATEYVWTAPTNATIISPLPHTNSIVVNFEASAMSGNVSVMGANECGEGISSSLAISVNITPFINTTYTPSICSGQLITVSPADGGLNVIPAGTTYSWGMPIVTGGITGGTSQSGQTNFNQTLTNPTNSSQTASYLVTASTAACSASTFLIVVTVDPKPVGSATPISQQICNSPNNTAIYFSQNTGNTGSYSWTRNNTANVGGMASSGVGTEIFDTLTNNTTVVQTTTFTVIATSQFGCQSEPFTASVTVNPTPTVSATPTTQTICSEETIDPIILGNPNNIAGTTFSWTRDNTTNVTGIPNGNGNTITGTLTNITNTAQTVRFNITASNNGCTSIATTVDVIVNPKPIIEVNLANQSVCEETAFATIVASNLNNVPGVTYSWTRDNQTNLTGVPNSGTGTTINGTFVNNTNTNQTAIFTIRATIGTCFSEITSEVLVKPLPLVLATPILNTVCNNGSFTINLSDTNNVAGTTYSWIRDNTTNITGISSSGTSSVISGNLSNNTGIVETTIFTITATSSGCSTTTSANVNVYAPLLTPEIADNQAVCLSTLPAILTITNLSSLGGSGFYTYQWERSDDGSTGWVNAPNINNTNSYQPPVITGQSYFYRVRLTDVCGSLVSLPVFIQSISTEGFAVEIDDDLDGILCSNMSQSPTLFSPTLTATHSTNYAVRYSWSADSNFITPSIGGPTGTTGGEFFDSVLLRTSTGTIGPLTAKNNTYATVTTKIKITPSVYNYANNNPGPGDFICTISPQYVDVTIRPEPEVWASVASTTICSGVDPRIEIYGKITDGPMRFRLSHVSTGVTGLPPNGTFINLAPGERFSYPVLTNTTGISQPITFKLTAYTNYDNNNDNVDDCEGIIDDGFGFDVIIAPNVTAGIISGNQTICPGEDPSAFTQDTASTGLSLSYQWEKSTTSATSGYSNISGASGIAYDDPGPVNQTTWYRRITTSTVNSMMCSASPSNVIEVSVNAFNAGIVGGSQTICSSEDPGEFTNIEDANNGIGTLSYQWQLNTISCNEPDGSWSDITGANDATYNPPSGLISTTYYRRVANYSSVNCSKVSNCVVIYVNNVTSGTIGNDQIFCDSNPDAFVDIIPSTGSGTLSYQWQRATTISGSWTNINTNGTDAIYDAPSGLSSITYFRRLTVSNLNGVECSALSNIVTVTPSTVTAGEITGYRTVCYGSDPTEFLVTVPATGTSLSYQWQSATVSGAGPWTNISGATNDTYDVPPGITTTTYFQRVVTSTVDGSSCSVNSNVLPVFVNDVTASTIGGDQSICNTQDPAPLTVIVPGNTGGFGTLNYQWQSSTTNSPYSWSDISSATNSTYDPSILLQTTYFQVKVISTLNGVACVDESNIVTITVIPYEDALASSPTVITNCNDTTIQLSGNLAGQWSAVSVPSGNSFSFSNTTDPNATFTGESGVTYDITWTIDNPSPCADEAATFQVVFPDCGNFIDFDGNNDYINVSNQYNLSSNFSVELWLKRDANTNSTQTLLSKRDANTLSTGYDLSLVNGQVSFRYNSSGVIQSPQNLDNSRWYHVAVTYNSGTYRLYIDGVEVISNSGPAPTSNTFNYLIGANGRLNASPQDYFDGSLDEIKIWNTALTESQIRETMNQEIEISGTNVRGSVLGMDVAGLNWSSLMGYYQLNQSSDINSGQLVDHSAANNVGALQNMTTLQAETAPIPYMSDQNGNWSTPSTWLNGNVQLIPNGLGVDG